MTSMRYMGEINVTSFFSFPTGMANRPDNVCVRHFHGCWGCTNPAGTSHKVRATSSAAPGDGAMEAELMTRIGRSTFRKIYYGALLCILILAMLTAMAPLDMEGRTFASLKLLFLTALSGAFWA